MIDTNKGTKQKRILLVEDDAMLREMYETKLKSEGYEVITADNGGDGLNLAKQGNLDLVMLDVMLPMLDGFSILAEMKSDNSIKNIPVVMLTNLGTENDQQKGQAMGAVDYLVKANMTPEQVSTTIKKYL